MRKLLLLQISSSHPIAFSQRKDAHQVQDDAQRDEAGGQGLLRRSEHAPQDVHQCDPRARTASEQEKTSEKSRLWRRQKEAPAREPVPQAKEGELRRSSRHSRRSASSSRGGHNDRQCSAYHRPPTDPTRNTSRQYTRRIKTIQRSLTHLFYIYSLYTSPKIRERGHVTLTAL